MSAGKTARRPLIEATALGVACYLAARAGLLFRVPDTSTAALWPEAGVGLAGLLIVGPGAWPALAVAMFAAWLPALPSNGSGVIAAAAFAAGSTAAQVLAAALVRTLCPLGNPFDRAKDAMWFIACAAFSCAVSAAFGSTALCALG